MKPLPRSTSRSATAELLPATPPSLQAAVTVGAVTSAELIDALGRVLAHHTPALVMVEGVVTSWRFQKRWGSGDLCAYGPDGKIVAKIPFAIPPTAMPPDSVRNDMVVVVTGRLETSPPWHVIRLEGQRLQIVADASIAATKREKLLELLTFDGRAERQKQLTLPPMASSIGLITAAGSAARADIIGTLAATKTPVHVVEQHVAFTGDTAATQIVRALEMLVSPSRVEAIIIARGGGAQNDLEVFDRLDVADAIANCPLPVITAIGHATNLTIADHVAHTNVVTPTAAAVLITAGHQRQQQLAKDHATAITLQQAARDADLARKQAERAMSQRTALLIVLIITVVIAAAAGMYSLLF